MRPGAVISTLPITSTAAVSVWSRDQVGVVTTVADTRPNSSTPTSCRLADKSSTAVRAFAALDTACRACRVESS